MALLRWQRPRPCWCGGYWFPHRKGGGACIHGPRSDYYHALRHGLEESEAMAQLSVAQLRRMYPLENDK